MIVDQIDIVSVILLKAKDDAPVRPDSNTPKVFKIAFEAMQSKAGQLHIFRLAGAIENGQDVFHFVDVICADRLSLSLFK